MTDHPPILSVMRRLGLEPDPWQLDVVEGNHRRLLLNCARQAGKSTAVAVLSMLFANLMNVFLRVVPSMLAHNQGDSLRVFDFPAPFFQFLSGVSLVLFLGSSP